MMRPGKLPKHPFRDSAIFYAVLAGAVIGFGLLTSNELLETVLIAAAFFVIATGYSWRRFRQRVQREGEESR
jgi:4-hydroxybenzoate polyprenyltransferase